MLLLSGHTENILQNMTFRSTHYFKIYFGLTLLCGLNFIEQLLVHQTHIYIYIYKSSTLPNPRPHINLTNIYISSL